MYFSYVSASRDDWKVGDKVILSSSEDKVRRSFDYVIYTWDDQMLDMLGNEYTILEITNYDFVAIPSPDGSGDGKLYFAKSAFNTPG